MAPPAPPPRPPRCRRRRPGAGPAGERAAPPEPPPEPELPPPAPRSRSSSASAWRATSSAVQLPWTGGDLVAEAGGEPPRRRLAAHRHRRRRGRSRLGLYRLQVAALRDEGQAAELARRLRALTGLAADSHFDAGVGLYRVRVGSFASREAAERRAGAATPAKGSPRPGWWPRGARCATPRCASPRGDQRRRPRPLARPSATPRGRATRASAVLGKRYRGDIRSTSTTAAPSTSSTRWRSRTTCAASSPARWAPTSTTASRRSRRRRWPPAPTPCATSASSTARATTSAPPPAARSTTASTSSTRSPTAPSPRPPARCCSTRASWSTPATARPAAATPRTSGWSSRWRTTPTSRAFPASRPASTGWAATCRAAPPSPTPSTRRLFPPPAPATTAPRPRPPSPRRLEALAAAAGLPVPHDRLASLARREVQRFVASLFDLALDARLFVAPEDVPYLLDDPPPDWSDEDRRRAAYLLKSGLLTGPPDRPLDEARSSGMVFRLAELLHLVEEETASYRIAGRRPAHRPGGRRGAVARPAAAPRHLPPPRRRLRERTARPGRRRSAHPLPAGGDPGRRRPGDRPRRRRLRPLQPLDLLDPLSQRRAARPPGRGALPGPRLQRPRSPFARRLGAGRQAAHHRRPRSDRRRRGSGGALDARPARHPLHHEAVAAQDRRRPATSSPAAGSDTGSACARWAPSAWPGAATATARSSSTTTPASPSPAPAPGRRAGKSSPPDPPLRRPVLAFYPRVRMSPTWIGVGAPPWCGGRCRGGESVLATPAAAARRAPRRGRGTGLLAAPRVRRALGKALIARFCPFGEARCQAPPAAGGRRAARWTSAGSPRSAPTASCSRPAAPRGRRSPSTRRPSSGGRRGSRTPRRASRSPSTVRPGRAMRGRCGRSSGPPTAAWARRVIAGASRRCGG